MNTDTTGYSLYYVWTSTILGEECEAIVQPDSDPPPAEVSDEMPENMPQDDSIFCRHVMAGLPKLVAELFAASFYATMEAMENNEALPPRLMPEQLKTLLFTLTFGSMEKARRLLRAWGRPHSQRDLELALAVSMGDDEIYNYPSN